MIIVSRAKRAADKSFYNPAKSQDVYDEKFELSSIVTYEIKNRMIF